MKLLLLADKESPYLWDYYQPGRLREYDLMLSCGDLKAEYLSFLATLGRAPLYYVRGNHDGNYDRRPPEGCDCIEDKLIIFNGPAVQSQQTLHRPCHRQQLVILRDAAAHIGAQPVHV